MATLKTIGSKSTNEELSTVFANNENLKKGHVIIACIEPTSNEDMFRMMLIQQKTGTASSTVSLAQAKLLGWNGSIERTWMNVAKEMHDSLESIRQGNTLKSVYNDIEELEEETPKIVVSWSNQPITWTDSRTRENKSQKQFENKNGEKYWSMVDGKRLPLFRNTSIQDISFIEPKMPEVIKVKESEEIFENQEA